MEVLQRGQIGVPAQRHVVAEVRLGQEPALTLCLKMAGWTVSETVPNFALVI